VHRVGSHCADTHASSPT